MITAAVIEAGSGAPNLVLFRGPLSCMQGHTHTCGTQAIRKDLKTPNKSWRNGKHFERK